MFDKPHLRFRDRRLPGFAVRVVLLLLAQGFSSSRDPVLAQVFEFGLQGPEQIHRNEEIEIAVTLRSSGIPGEESGVEGWQFGVGHENLEIRSVTFEGTVVENFLDGSFVFIQISDDGEGFVSGVILSIVEDPASLPTNGVETVARARYMVEREACSTGARIEIREGVRSSGGGRIANRVIQNNEAFSPAIDRLDYPHCDPNSYGLAISPSLNPILIPGSDRANTVEATVFLEQLAPTASGWTLAVAHDPAVLSLLGVTLEDTDVEPFIEADGFALFEITNGPGNDGFVSQVELSTEALRALPGEIRAVARATYQFNPYTELPAGRFQTSIRLAESLRGSGGPFANRVFPEGFLDLQEQLDLFVENTALQRFVRGDANTDGSLDIGDPVSALFYLFAGAEPACLEAINVNADDRLDTSDVVHALSYLFLEGAPPPSPFPDCGGGFHGFDCARSACP